MNLLEMKRRFDSVPQPEMQAALAEFRAHLVTLGRRQKFTICPPRKVIALPRVGSAPQQAGLAAKSREAGG